MISILVKVPYKSRKRFCFSLRKQANKESRAGNMKANTGISVFRRLENRLRKVVLTEGRRVKIAIKVDYGDRYTNEGEYSTKKEALYTLVCFMEDYLPAKFLDNRLKKYHPIRGRG